MPTIKGRHIKYAPSEEGLLRRLGGALVVQWDSLTEIQRELFLAQATMMGDRDETVQLREQLKAFIAERKADD